MKFRIHILIVSIVLFAVACNSSSSSQTLDPVAFKNKIATTPEAFILDVRTPSEFADGFIKNAVNIDYNSDNFKSEVKTLDKNKTYFVYCLSGKRSAAAADYMRSVGFKNMINLEGGILAWQHNNLPLTTTSAPVADKISLADYQQLIASDKTVLVDFFAPWCAPCIKMKPMLEELANEYKGKVKIVRIDISENKQLAQQLDVVQIPILKVFKNGKETWTYNGLAEKQDIIKQF